MRFLTPVPLLLLFSGCAGGLSWNTPINGITGSFNSTDGGKISTSGNYTNVTFNAPEKNGYTSFTLGLGNFQSSSICTSAKIFGLSGTAICGGPGVSSNAFRVTGTTQISATQETTKYLGATLPSNYSEISDILSADDGYYNSDAGCGAACTSVSSISWVQHTTVLVNCGTSQNAIPARISDCASKNSTLATWSGAASGNTGEGIWKLVTRNTPQGVCTGTMNSCRPVEVWQDQLTGLLWSSLVAGSAASSGGGQATDNWCRAAGNDQSTTILNPWTTTDPSGYCNNASYQNQTTPTSYCAETAVYGPTLSPALATENWTTGVYDLAKGNMGANSTPNNPTVRWRLPTLHDYGQAEIDGIRHVMPDMGAMGSGGEWSASLNSNLRSNAFIYNDTTGVASLFARTNPYAIRCVGH